MTIKRAIYISLGFACLGLGCVGVLLPILPTVPFFLATVFFFAKSSPRLHGWFIGTGLYKNHLESYVQKRGMTVKTKVGIIVPVTLLMGFAFYMMAAVPIGRAVLGIVWLGHIVYFVFGVKTIKPEKSC